METFPDWHVEALFRCRQQLTLRSCRRCESDGPDARLDDLNAKVNRGFDRVEEELRAQRGEITDLRTKINTRFDGMNGRFDEERDRSDARFDGVNARFDAMNTRFDALNRTLLTSALGLVIALIASKAIPF
jgi:hypothetical protein